MNDEIKVIPYNPGRKGMAILDINIPYTLADGTEMKLAFMHPYFDPPEGGYPLIVYIQGCGFTDPAITVEAPQFASFAQRGYAVAMIPHRSYENGFQFPTYLEDVKTGLRFLRANVETYKINPRRVCAFGTSSGANTALLLGMTGNDPRYHTAAYAEQPDDVQLVVECFGPADMLQLLEFDDELPEMLDGLAGAPWQEHKEKVVAMSPYLIADEAANYPPIYILHGSADKLIPYSQSERLYRKLRDMGKDVRMTCVENGPHEEEFWSEAVFEDIYEYIHERL